MCENNLEIESPYPKPNLKKEAINIERIKNTQGSVEYKHYGKLIIMLIKECLKIKDSDRLNDVQSFNLDEGISWHIGSQNRNEKNIDFWIGKRAQSGKKVPKRFNKNLRFYD